LSYQTKEQSIGYLLKGAMNTSIPAIHLKEINSIAQLIIESKNDITNNDTLDFADRIAESLGFREELRREFRGEVYWTFDLTSVEEAGEYYDLISKLF